MGSIGESLAAAGEELGKLGAGLRKINLEEKKAQALESYATTWDKVDPQIASSIRADRTDIAAITGYRKEKEEGKTKFQKTFEEFSLSNSMTKEIQNQLSLENQKVQKAYESGDENVINQAKQNYAAKYEILGEKAKTIVVSLDKDLQFSAATQMMSNVEKKLKDLSPEKVSLMDETFKDIMNKSKMNPKMIKEMEDLKSQYGVDVDISGIPDSQSVYKIAVSGIGKNTISKEMVNMIMNSTNADELISSVNSDALSKDAKILAGAVAKQLMAIDRFAPALKEQFKGKSMSELLAVSTEEMGGTLGERVKNVASEEMRARGAFKKEGLFSGIRSTMQEKEVKSAYKLIKEFNAKKSKGEKIDPSLASRVKEAKKIVSESESLAGVSNGLPNR